MFKGLRGVARKQLVKEHRDTLYMGKLDILFDEIRNPHYSEQTHIIHDVTRRFNKVKEIR